MGLAATALTVSVAVLIGGTTGFIGGRQDLVTQRFVDAWMALPGLLFLLTIYPNEVQQRWDVNVPTVDPWTMSEVDSIGNKFFNRNPYYYRIDIAGNQLPYIDRQDRILFSNKEAINLAAISGELDYAQQDLVTESYQLYKENEERGQYRVSMWYDGRGSVLVDHKINMNHPDPVKRELFGDVRFRQAGTVAGDQRGRQRDDYAQQDLVTESYQLSTRRCSRRCRWRSTATRSTRRCSRGWPRRAPPRCAPM